MLRRCGAQQSDAAKSESDREDDLLSLFHEGVGIGIIIAFINIYVKTHHRCVSTEILNMPI
jgi:hypothetical protein